jgi:O-antigen/teichoic acid export membrane protein
MTDRRVLGTALRREISSGVLIRCAALGVSYLRGIVLVSVISRGLGQAGYGMWSQVVASAALLAPLLSVSLSSAATRYFPAARSHGELRQQVHGQLLFTAVVSAAVLALCSTQLGSLSGILFGSPDFQAEARLALLLAGVHALILVGRSYFRGTNRVGTYSSIEIAQLVAELGVIAVLVARGTPSLATILRGIVGVDAAILAGILVGITAEVGPPTLPRWATMRRDLRFSIPLIPNAVLLWVMNLSDRYVITHVRGLEEAGMYSAAYTVGSVVNAVMLPLSFGFAALASRLWEEGDRGAVARYIRTILKYYALLALPAGVGLVELAPSVSRLLTGSDAAFGSDIMLFIVLGLGVFSVSMVTSYPLNLAERTAWVLPISLLAAGMNLGLNLLLVPRMGALAAALTTFASYSLRTLALNALARRCLRYSVDWATLLRATAAAAIMWAAIHYVPWEGRAWVAGKIALGVVVYFAAVGVLGQFRRSPSVSM